MAKIFASSGFKKVCRCCSPFLLYFLFACATTGSRKFETTLNSWLGHDVTELSRAIGYPTRTFKAPNGNTVYAYEKASSGYIPAFTTPTYTNIHGYGNSATAVTTGGQTIGGFQVNYWCNTFFETDSANKIVFWRWEGNACR